MCVIDWGIIAPWVGALATVGLVVTAYIGFGQWKNQFVVFLAGDFNEYDNGILIEVDDV